jgi:hypothetical protein
LDGTNGVQFESSIANAPTTTNRSSTTIFSATIALLTPADWRVPTTSSAVVPATTRIAGRFTMPLPLPNGGLARSWGTWIPSESRKLTA